MRKVQRKQPKGGRAYFGFRIEESACCSKEGMAVGLALVRGDQEREDREQGGTREFRKEKTHDIHRRK